MAGSIAHVFDNGDVSFAPPEVPALDVCALHVGALDVQALDDTAPGPALAEMLAGVDTRFLNGHARVSVMRAWDRLSSWASAQMYEAMSHVARSPECMPDSSAELTEHFTEFASAEVGAALTLSPGSADRELSFAYHLTERLPGTRAALMAGRISLAKAKEIADETSVLSAELARAAEEFVLAHASDLTRQQIARRLRAKVIQLDPEGAEERRQEAQRERQVQFGPDGAGTATISGTCLPVAQVAAAKAFVRDLARALHESGDDDRTLAQVEADVVLDLLQGRHLDAQGVDLNVELVAPLETWLSVADQLGAAASGAGGEHVGIPPTGAHADSFGRAARVPGEVVGFGPVSAELMAEIVAMSNNDFDFCATVTREGRVVFHDRLSYRPSRRQRNLVRARDRTCRHPGCTRPAARCDTDHTTEHRLGGPTCACNLVSLCRRHHRAKHEGRWWWNAGADSVQSPLGHTYPAMPEPPLPTQTPNRQAAGGDTTIHARAPF